MAKVNPDNSLILFDGHEITYKELDELSHSLAYYVIELKRMILFLLICERSYYFFVASFSSIED